MVTSFDECRHSVWRHHPWFFDMKSPAVLEAIIHCLSLWVARIWLTSDKSVTIGTIYFGRCKSLDRANSFRTGVLPMFTELIRVRPILFDWQFRLWMLTWLRTEVPDAVNFPSSVPYILNSCPAAAHGFSKLWHRWSLNTAMWCYFEQTSLQRI